MKFDDVMVVGCYAAVQEGNGFVPDEVSAVRLERKEVVTRVLLVFSDCRRGRFLFYKSRK